MTIGRTGSRSRVISARGFLATAGWAGLALLYVNAGDQLPPGLPVKDLPPEIRLSENARLGVKPICIPLQIGDGGELPFILDTGAAFTVLDDSLAPRLGRRLRTRRNPMAFDPVAGRRSIYAAPELYLGGTRLLTGREISTVAMRGAAYSQAKGILGWDCLQHYCIQLDFEVGKLRFLDPETLQEERLGKPIPLTLKGELPTIAEIDLFGEGRQRFVLDTGFSGQFDIMLASNFFERVMWRRKPDWTNAVMNLGFAVCPAVYCPELPVGGESYSAIGLGEIGVAGPMHRAGVKGVIGLHFLARHLVTLDFPKRTLYLKRTTGVIPASRPIKSEAPDHGGVNGETVRKQHPRQKRY
ncbi:MAG: aspartyl protease family protein [Verrucomicrobia bacterium]|nr:aspartyl protease family protein [Verrucomicrobiota bacterium]